MCHNSMLFTETHLNFAMFYTSPNMPPKGYVIVALPLNGAMRPRMGKKTVQPWLKPLDDHTQDRT